jgi:hypothetical protein
MFFKNGIFGVPFTNEIEWGMVYLRAAKKFAGPHFGHA